MYPRYIVSIGASFIVFLTTIQLEFMILAILMGNLKMSGRINYPFER